MNNDIIMDKDDLSTGMLVRFRNGENRFAFQIQDLYFTPQTIKQLKL